MEVCLIEKYLFNKKKQSYSLILRVHLQVIIANPFTRLGTNKTNSSSKGKTGKKKIPLVSRNYEKKATSRLKSFGRET